MDIFQWTHFHLHSEDLTHVGQCTFAPRCCHWPLNDLINWDTLVSCLNRAYSMSDEQWVNLCPSSFTAKERILSNLQKHPIPHPAPEMQHQNAPVADVPTTCLTDAKAAAKLLQQDLSNLQGQARYTSAYPIYPNKNSQCINTCKQV